MYDASSSSVYEVTMVCKSNQIMSNWKSKGWSKNSITEFSTQDDSLLNNPAGRSEWNTEMDKEERGKWEEKVHKKATFVGSNGEASWFLTWAAMLPTYGKSWKNPTKLTTVCTPGHFSKPWKGHRFRKKSSLIPPWPYIDTKLQNLIYCGAVWHLIFWKKTQITICNSEFKWFADW